MRADLARILWASATYGASVGMVHSARQALHDVVKFPLLILVTSLLCGLAYFAAALFVTRDLLLRDVTAFSLRTYAAICTLLASLAPVCLFLALTLEQPTTASLNDYPLFLGLNVALIALCGVTALTREARRLTEAHTLTRSRAIAVTLAWLALSLLAGGQCAWTMRPFFGVSSIPELRFMDGARPDHRGATSFYEAVWHLVSPERP